MAIKTFGDKKTVSLYKGTPAPGFPGELLKIAHRKLHMIHAAMKVDDLFSPPGNRLEKLKGKRKGWWSIRINSQWRICFLWDNGAEQVQVEDYHDDKR